MIDPNDRAEWPGMSDDRLMGRLAELFRQDGPPAEAVELARQSFALRTLDTELAALVEDSQDPEMQPVAVRDHPAGPDRRQLGFHFHDGRTGDELIIAVEVEERHGRCRIIGQLTPQVPASIEVRQPAAPRARRVDVDQFGRFIIEDVLPGPASLTCRRAGAPAVATQWTLL